MCISYQWLRLFRFTSFVQSLALSIFGEFAERGTDPQWQQRRGYDLCGHTESWHGYGESPVLAGTSSN